jgi:hypothetical protein
MEVIDDGRDIRLKPKHASFQAEWVRLPASWINRLEQSNSASTFKLAHRILKEAFKRKHVGGEIVLSRKVTGLPCTTTTRAARELVNLGLIQIQQSGNKATRVVNLLLKEQKKEGQVATRGGQSSNRQVTTSGDRDGAGSE